MKLIEIKPLSNGAHRNQTGDFVAIPEGYAVIPEEMETPNFPFGTITTEEIDGIMTVTSWIAGEILEIEQPPQPISDIEQLRADVDYIAVMTGVEL